MALIQISLLHDAYNLALSTFHAVDEGLSVRVGLGWLCKKRHKVILIRAECPYVQFELSHVLTLVCS